MKNVQKMVKVKKGFIEKNDDKTILSNAKEETRLVKRKAELPVGLKDDQLFCGSNPFTQFLFCAEGARKRRENSQIVSRII
jgi:hypothetical protein